MILTNHDLSFKLLFKDTLISEYEDGNKNGK